MSFQNLLDKLEESVFEEKPVELTTFLYDAKYLGLKVTLSDIQYDLVAISSQIYKPETLIELYGVTEGLRRSGLSYQEIIYVLGKGSGKDFCSELALAYVVYQLLCLKEPAEYFGKDTGDAIDIINVAINSDQANNVFFAGFKRIISKAPWFAGKFNPKQRHFAFDKNVNVYSGHSEAEAFEGYNTLMVILDEISGFDSEKLLKPGEELKAKVLYDMYKDSVVSRFAEYGKVLLLSFPRYKKDFIMTKYEDAIEEKHVVQRTYTMKINPELPDGIRGNEYTIAWDEDHIIKYKKPGVFCLKRPSWEVNPTKTPETYLERFISDPIMALKKYACMPPESEMAFFTSREKIEHAFRAQNGIDDLGRFIIDAPDPVDGEDETGYYVHVDLARLHDRCAVAMAHVDHFGVRDIGGTFTEPAPYVKVDILKYWTPTSENHVDFTEVREFILNLQRRGFNIRMVTFDRWESYDISKELREYGLNVEKLSVAKKHYTDMAMVVHEERLSGPEDQILIDELLELRVMNNDKIDHPTKGSKDLSDAVCGAIFNAIAYTPRQDREIEVVSGYDIEPENARPVNKPGMIVAPRREEAPEELMDFLAGLSVI
jgi:hypothetical protein